tara:strand:- start:2301 stop:2468 length:168 start_codon:yes stop_codon:yes gene_type:complete
MTYKLSKLNSAGKQTTVIRTNADGTKTYIPFEDLNSDYIEYKAWVAAGNTPEEAD